MVDGDAALSLAVAAVLAGDRSVRGGAVLRAGAGPVRDAWVAALRAALPPGTPWKTVPPHADTDRLLGGLDLAATLAARRPVERPGLLAEAAGGVLVLAMAERTEPAAAAHVAAALDAAEGGLFVLALDEGEGDERLDPALLDRAALVVDLRAVRPRAAPDPAPPFAADADAVAAARAAWRARAPADALVGAFVEGADALGIVSLRAPMAAVRVAAVVAALAGRPVPDAGDVSAAARLVLAPRARRLPAVPPPDAEAPADASPPPEDAPRPDAPPPADAAPPPDGAAGPDGAPEPLPAEALDALVVAAAAAAMPAELLAALVDGGPSRGANGAGGRSARWRLDRRRGRPVASRRGRPRDGARLDLLATLRAAAPWQRIRRDAAAPVADGSGTPARLALRLDDLHVRRHRSETRTTTIFAVDASGSSALHRLAEAKGAVELLLAACYVRRDRVAVVAFRGGGAEVLLPPTRALVRAKRALAGLPGGGGTPLAAGVDAAHALALDVRRQGDAALVVVLSDGRANVARGGVPGRERAAADALAACRASRADGVAALFVDTSPRPDPAAALLAAALGARYLPLPHADAARLSAAVQGAGAAAR